MDNEKEIIKPNDNVTDLNTKDYLITSDYEDLNVANNMDKITKKLFTIENIFLVIRVLVGIIIMWLLRPVYDLLKDFGFNLFDLFNITISDLIYKLWLAICLIAYVGVGTFIIYFAITHSFEDIRNKFKGNNY